MPGAEQRWTEAELDVWVDEVIGGPDAIDTVLERRLDGQGRLEMAGARPAVADRLPGALEGDADLARFATAWNDLFTPGLDPFLAETPVPTTAAAGWGILSVEAKSALRRGWERATAQRELDVRAEADSIVPELLGPLPEKVEPPPSTARPPWQVPMALIVLGLLVGAIWWAWFSGDDGTEDVAPTTSGATTSTTAPGTPSDDDLPIEVLTDDGVATYVGPTRLPIGQEVVVAVTVIGADGRPLVGVPWFLTVGSETTAEDAVHVRSSTDEHGRAIFPVAVSGPEGRRGVWTSDGTSVWQVTSDAEAVAGD